MKTMKFNLITVLLMVAVFGSVLGGCNLAIIEEEIDENPILIDIDDLNFDEDFMVGFVLSVMDEDFNLIISDDFNDPDAIAVYNKNYIKNNALNNYFVFNNDYFTDYYFKSTLDFDNGGLYTWKRLNDNKEDNYDPYKFLTGSYVEKHYFNATISLPQSDKVYIFYLNGIFKDNEGNYYSKEMGAGLELNGISDMAFGRTQNLKISGNVNGEHKEKKFISHIYLTINYVDVLKSVKIIEFNSDNEQISNRIFTSREEMANNLSNGVWSKDLRYAVIEEVYEGYEGDYINRFIYPDRTRKYFAKFTEESTGLIRPLYL